MKQTYIELKRETEISTSIVSYFNAFFAMIDRISTQKISKEIEDLTTIFIEIEDYSQ